MLWILYQIAVGLALLAVAPVLLIRRGRHYGPTIAARLGRRQPDWRPSTGPTLWLHAVSVGEVGVAASFLRSIPEPPPLLVSTITPTGQSQARQQLAGKATITYLPFDFNFAIRRFFKAYTPGALVLVEGDLWPLILHQAKLRRLPVVVINGRISDRNFRRLKRLRKVVSPLLTPVDCFAMQSGQDRERLLSLGVPEEKIVVTGNLKFDTRTPQRQPELESQIAEAAAGRKVLIAGSTMPSEEAIVLDAFEPLGAENLAMLILAPRHPERWGEVADLIEKRGFRYRRRSQPADGGSHPSILLLDSLGELASLYRIATAAFIGGTLVDTGGHNAIEAACCGIPIAVGPSMRNFPDLSRVFDEALGWQRVSDAESLSKCWRRWLEQSEEAEAQGRRGARLVELNRGATQRTLTVLRRFIPDLVGGSRWPS